MGRMWNEAALNNFKVLVKHLHGRTEEIMNSEDSWSLDQNSNTEIRKHKAEKLRTTLGSGTEQL